MKKQEARPTEIAATTRAPQSEKSPLVCLAGIVLWWGVCWFAADAHFKNLTDNAYREESSKAELYVTETAAEFQKMIDIRTRLSRHLSVDPEVRRAFARFGPAMSGAELPFEERQRRWTATPALASLNRYLAGTATGLQNGIVALVDAEGNCFAASGANTVNSTIGINYGDRDYMPRIRDGKDGYQVLLGKQSGQPGVTVYVPVIEGGRVLGALLSRLGLGSLHGHSFTAFMTDRHGAIMLANQPGLVGHLMTESRPDKASPGRHQTSAPSGPQALLEITPGGDADYPELKHVPGSDHPVIFRSASASATEPAIHVLWPFPHRAQFVTTRNLVIWAVGLLGTLSALLVRSHIAWRRERGRHLHELEQAVTKRTAELQNVNEFLSLKSYAINHIKESVFLIDPAGVILYANEEAGRALGFSREELVGMRAHDVDPAINDTTWQEHWCQLRSAKSMAFEGQHRRKDGTVFPVEISANLFNYEGREYNLALARDVTSRKESEERLVASAQKIAESHELLRQLAAHRDTAREDERKHMAREIHDELGQILTSMRMEISTAHLQIDNTLAVLNGHCLRLIDRVDQAIQFTRNLVTSLRPAALDMGLVPALDWLAAEFQARCNVDCHLSLPATEPRLDETQSVALFRITQEALTNASRYAEARHVTVTLSVEDTAYRLVVSDDGRGFDDTNKRSHSFGLLGIRERTLMLGGSAHIDSTPGSGTTVEVRIPIFNFSDEKTPS
jgi:PAS domain S-box-containing protein